MEKKIKPTNNINLDKLKKAKWVKTQSRSSKIHQWMIGKKFHVYNGKSYITFYIKDRMVGYKLGEFVPTRTKGMHKKKKLKIKEAAKKAAKKAQTKEKIKLPKKNTKEKKK